MRVRLSPKPLLLLLSAITALMCVSAPAHANSKYAAYVIHAETGDVLFDKYSNENRYPASLTKMMTLYLLFEAIDSGELTLDSKLYVSKRASLQPASRLGLQKGTSITVEKAIEALVIRSANDVATVVAEKLGGTESQFARMMTQRAREIGMRRTTFRNASGLPDRRQVTTARDMATLSQRISQDFPQYFHYFDQNSFVWKGKTYTSHNRVAMNYKGADGLKTGYTRASGYNLATTAQRDGERLIGVVLGGRSTRTRDAHMEQILSTAFAQIRRKPTLLSAVHRVRPVPNLKPGTLPASASQTVTLAQLAAESTATPVPTPKTLAMALPEFGLTSETANLDISSLQVALADMESNAPEEEPLPIGEGDAEPLSDRAFAVQIGAYRKEELALARIRDMESTVRSVALIPGKEVRISSNTKGPLYRARFTRLTEDEAEEACRVMKAQKADCLVIRSE